MWNLQPQIQYILAIIFSMKAHNIMLNIHENCNMKAEIGNAEEINYFSLFFLWADNDVLGSTHVKLKAN